MTLPIQAKVIQDCEDTSGNAYKAGDLIEVEWSSHFRYYEVKDMAGEAGAIKGLIASRDIEVLGLKKN